MVTARDDSIDILPTPEERRRRVIAPLIAVLLVAAVAVLLAATGRPAGGISGSGSTLAQPLIQQSAGSYRTARSADNPTRVPETGRDWMVDGAGISYDGVGSLGGIVAVSQGSASFAVADYPLSSQELDDRDLIQFPLAFGAVAVVVSQDVAADGELQLDAETLAAIYSGEITAWDDPRIAALNPELDLPSAGITPVHRSDGSGSTAGFTRYLSSTAWADGPGDGPQITWPEGVGAASEGSSGMVEAVDGTAGAIGYVDAGQARRAGLPLVALQNTGGTFETPSAEAVGVAISQVDWSAPGDFSSLQVDTGARGAYPMTVGVYAMVPASADAENRQVLSFLRFIIDSSDGTARELGYTPLPEDGADAVLRHWENQLDYAAT